MYQQISGDHARLTSELPCEWSFQEREQPRADLIDLLAEEYVNSEAGSIDGYATAIGLQANAAPAGVTEWTGADTSPLVDLLADLPRSWTRSSRSSAPRSS